MSTEVIPTPKPVLTLYELEDDLAALANTFEMVEEGKARQMILDEIGRALRQAKEKRDALVGSCGTAMRNRGSPIRRSSGSRPGAIALPSSRRNWSNTSSGSSISSPFRTGAG
jgi:hypothetical protein